MIETIKGGAAVEGTLKAPSSKSYAQRAIAAALMSNGQTTLTNIDLSNDTAAALDVAAKLGAVIENKGNGTYLIKGGLRPLSNVVNVGESGLSARMFTPIVSLLSAPMTITGEGSIMQRPLDMMVAPLKELGVEITTQGGYLPIVVNGSMKGGETVVDGSQSSQFLTGLLMSLPVAELDSRLEVRQLTSMPYIDMTLEMLEDFGIEVVNEDYKTFIIKGRQQYRAIEYNVEGDWSGASCLLVAGAIAGSVVVTNLNPCSRQADRAIIDALRLAGAEVMVSNGSVAVSKLQLKAFEFDATQCPDLFPALAALAACCDGITVLKGAQRLVYKESDRAATIASEFGKAGIKIDIDEHDIMKITGGVIKGARVHSHNDHRIAMALGVAGLVCEGIMEVEDSLAIDKSYPGFWRDLRNLI